VVIYRLSQILLSERLGGGGCTINTIYFNNSLSRSPSQYYL